MGKFKRYWKMIALTIIVILSSMTLFALRLVQSGGNDLGVLKRISFSSTGVQSNGDSEWANISRNGRYVLYHSDASNLVANDTNNSTDVFLYDRFTRTTQRISYGLGGIEGNNRSMFADFSGDGRFVTFHSEATNLIPNDTNNTWDVFVRDLQTGQFDRISVNSNSSQANGASIFPDISADGRFVAFYSSATNLVPNDTNGVEDVFLYDRLTQSTERISLSSAGVQANSYSIFPDISADGRYISYESYASNLVSGDTNGVWDVFLYDRLTGTTERISLNSAEQQGNGDASYAIISADNRFVTYNSHATNIDPADPNPNGDIYVRDLVSGTTELISTGLNNTPTTGDSHYPFISADGRLIVYHSDSSNIVPGDTNNTDDIFLYDRQTGITKRINIGTTGSQANDTSSNPTISDNGRIMVFHSYATNLVPGDTNGTADIFLYLDIPFQAHLPVFYR